jgi:heme/copper-type cytochrome/quinol oxidase subunit 2
MSSPTREHPPNSAGVSPDAATAAKPESSLAKLKLVTWSGFFFAILQSVCSAFIALSGVRLLIGIGAFAAASSALRIADRIHIDAIRIPMMLLALVGSIWNLVALWRVWSLRRRPSSAWRQQPVPQKKKRSEYLQFTLSLLTLLLLAVESFAHYVVLGKR